MPRGSDGVGSSWQLLALFHGTGVKNFLLPLRGEGDLVLSMGEPRLERAIGVVYVPQTERQSHYFENGNTGFCPIVPKLSAALRTRGNSVNMGADIGNAVKAVIAQHLHLGFLRSGASRIASGNTSTVCAKGVPTSEERGGVSALDVRSVPFATQSVSNAIFARARLGDAFAASL